MKHIRIWDSPSSDEVGSSVESFLERLGGPTWLHFPGKDPSRTRVFTTLFHGNEPSGVRALRRWLGSGNLPATNLVCFVAMVETALTEPRFSHRMLPERRDFNRCFEPPFNDVEGEIAEELLTLLKETQPECLLDVHNTSGSGPAYAVTSRLSPDHLGLTSLFTNHIILTDLRLGALMEVTKDAFPTLVIECGGAADAPSHEIAWQGFQRYVTDDQVLEPRADAPPVVSFEHPIRVELSPDASVAYGQGAISGVDLTLWPDVDRHNFCVVDAGQTLGWFGPRGIEVIQARCTQGKEYVDDFFEVCGNELRVARPLRLFMITTNPMIARKDCLFYILDADDPEA